MLRGRFSHVLTLVLLLAVPHLLCLLVLVLGASMIARLLAAATKPLNCRMLGGAVISVWVRTTIFHADAIVMRTLIPIPRYANLIVVSLLDHWRLPTRRAVTALLSLFAPAASGAAVAVRRDACGAASRVVDGIYHPTDCFGSPKRGRRPGSVIRAIRFRTFRGGARAGGAVQSNVCLTLRSF